MTQEYTPTTEKVKQAYSGLHEKNYYDFDATQREENFDRWLAAHDAQIRAEALNELKPKSGKWFPNEGAVFVKGKLYFDSDYMLTREDIRQIRAEALKEALSFSISEQKLFVKSMLKVLETYGCFDQIYDGWEDVYENAFVDAVNGQYGFDAVEAGIKAVNQLRESTKEEDES